MGALGDGIDAGAGTSDDGERRVALTRAVFETRKGLGGGEGEEGKEEGEAEEEAASSSSSSGRGEGYGGEGGSGVPSRGRR